MKKETKNISGTEKQVIDREALIIKEEREKIINEIISTYGKPRTYEDCWNILKQYLMNYKVSKIGKNMFLEEDYVRKILCCNVY